MTVTQRLTALREHMAAKHIDACLVPTADFHLSEYVGEYFKCRKFITGFTGSAGTAVITQDEAALWTDGRYFLQAARELEGSGIILEKMGEEGVPTVDEYLASHLTDGQTLGFDGRCMSAVQGRRFEEQLGKQGVRLEPDADLVGEIWEDRPARSAKEIWELGTEYTGCSRAEKIRNLRKALEEKGAQWHVLTSLDDIAWLLNLRGDDVACNPVFLANVIVSPETLTLYVQEEALPETVRQALAADGVQTAPYDEFYEALRAIPDDACVLLDSAIVNYAAWKKIPEGTKRLEEQNPTLLPKSIKTPVEMENMRLAHLKDGAALTHFMYWLKQSAAASARDRAEIDRETGKKGVVCEYDADGQRGGVMTEISASDHLEALRKEQEHFLGLSFDTICSWGPHAAIVHYSATPETDIPVEDHSFLLVDSGGQYLEGTTDVTRTFAMGETTQEEKEYFTRVLKGHLALAAAKFKYGTSGLSLDALARGPLWAVGKDYNHGTGHGVGYLLNVHEGPNSISYKAMQGRRTPCVFEEGMITSDEPGFYLEGKFGIRHENLVLCRKAEKNEYGQFMEFEILTLAPFDLDALLPEMLTEDEKATLNAYHEKVYAALSPLCEGEEKEWLRRATRAV